MQPCEPFRSGVGAPDLAGRQCIYAATAEALRPGCIDQVGLVELIRGVDLPQGALPGVAQRRVGYVVRPVNQQARLLLLVESLSKKQPTPGQPKFGCNVPGQF